jgi:hypothetical protein
LISYNSCTLDFLPLRLGLESSNLKESVFEMLFHGDKTAFVDNDDEEFEVMSKEYKVVAADAQFHGVYTKAKMN